MRKIMPVGNCCDRSLPWAAAFVGMAMLFFAGCAGWEVYPSGTAGNGRGVVGNDHDVIGNGRDHSLQSYQTLHFIVMAPTLSKAEQTAQISEKTYEKIMFDANLLSFKPKENYPIVIYRDGLEYQQKTGFPRWSGGGTSTQLLGRVLPAEREIRALTSIQTFIEIITPSLLAHEISHLIFNEHMEFFTAEDAERVRWLNEGFAMVQEMEAWDSPERDEYVKLTRSLILSDPMPLANLTSFNPFRDPQINLGSYIWRGRSILYTNIDLWYWQSRELTSYLIQTQGPYNFYLLLEALKGRKPLEQAISEAYPGKWRGLSELEAAWKQTQK